MRATKHRIVKHRTVWEIFAIPLVIGVFSAIGLTSALIGDGVWDSLSWLLLLVPICICTVCILFPSK